MAPARRQFLAAIAAVGALAGGATPSAAAASPSVLLVTVDTLRTDRMSGYGHHRRTSPRIDALLARGARFLEARTPAPLTGPAMASMLTALHPHEHGATRNGLRVRPRLVSLAGILGRRGYRTAAFVGNWTLKPEISGLDEYFDVYEALLNRSRWFGLARREATAEDLSAAALDWLDSHLEAEAERPFLLWVHYVEPHAPYRLQREFLEQVGVKRGATFFSARNRYDTEIAYVDDRIGRFLDAVGERLPLDELLVVFTADHGESLGEHGYWGHGRHLYDVTLRVPMGFVWPRRLVPREIAAPATLLDVAPTVLALLAIDSPIGLQGLDWSAVMAGTAAEPRERVTWHQAHKSAVEPKEEIERLRQRGLLEVGRLAAGRKEIYRVANGRNRLFELASDPREKKSLITLDTVPSAELRAWLGDVERGLARADELPPPSLSEEDVAALRALGYLD